MPPTQVVSSDVEFTTQYKPFGELVNPEGEEKYLYAGQRLDGETGLYHMGARYYSPAVGRFVSEDPVKGSALMPQTLNPYAYGVNPFSDTESYSKAPK